MTLGLLIFIVIEFEILFFSFYTEREVSKIARFQIQKIDIERYVPKILIQVAKCESGNRQFYPDGSLVRGKVNPRDIGRFQISEFYWLKKSQELGLDIFLWRDNTLFAFWLYTHYGTNPWNWSKSCWDK